MRNGVLCFLAAASGFLAGCGAVGDPMPPALEIPARSSDLEAVQRGDRLILAWTSPALTTEGQPLEGLERAVVVVLDIEGASAGESEFEARGRELSVVERPEAGSRIERRAPLPAPPGRRVALAVKYYGRRNRAAGLSNIVEVEIVRAPAAPQAPRAEAQPGGIRLAWPAVESADGYQVYRSTPERPGFALAATLDTPSFTDADFVWKAAYSYFVRAFGKISTGVVESAESPVVVVAPEDTFAPSTPAGLQAVAGESAVELSWNLSPEADTAGYHVYRGGERLNTVPLSAPAFSDRGTGRGRQYSYTVSAVDDKGNESPPSAPVLVNVP